MFDIDDCTAWFATNATKKITDSFNEKLFKEGVTRVQWVALFYLGKFGSMSQYELGEKMNIKSSTVVRLMDRMEKEEYIIREKTMGDRRKTFIEITKKGIDRRKKTLPVNESFNKDLKKGISEDDLEIFKNVLSKMVENV